MLLLYLVIQLLLSLGTVKMGINLAMSICVKI